MTLPARSAIRRRGWLLPALVLALLTLAGPALADDPDPSAGNPPPCGSVEEATLAAVDCAGGVPADEEPEGGAEAAAAVATLDPAFSDSFVVPDDAGLPANCRLPAKVVVYTSSDWLRLGQKLVADASPCGEYFISIPPLAADKTRFRVLQDDLLRALGPRIHPLAEIHVGGWQAWVVSNGTTWYEAGVEARRRMAAAGYGSETGESWAVNEFSSAVRRGDGNARRNMRDFLRGLYEGDAGMPPLHGDVFVIGLSQALADTSVYRRTLQGWLSDAGFWTDMNAYVRYFAQEVYPDVRNTLVPGSPRAERAKYLNDYLQHLPVLAEAGPDAASDARSFLRRAYTPLANAAWPWDFGFGWTLVPVDTMNHMVATQTYAVRHFAGSNPQLFPGERIGFAYAPNPRPGIPLPELAAGTGLIADRLASSLHHAYDNGGGSPAGACGPPGEHVWCDAEVVGAFLNPAWQLLRTWETSA
jgi:hypothetical protein